MQVANDTDLNKELQAAYRTLNEIVVNAINPDIIIGYLFAAKVLSTADSVDLLNITPEASKSRKILMLLHSRGHPEAFVKLHEAIKEESTCDWLVKQVEDLRTSSKGNVSDAFKHVVEETARFDEHGSFELVVSKDKTEDNDLVIEAAASPYHRPAVVSVAGQESPVSLKPEEQSQPQTTSEPPPVLSTDAGGGSERLHSASAVNVDVSETQSEINDTTVVQSSAITLKYVTTIHDDRRPVVGVTSIDSRLFVLRGKPSQQQIQVYDTESFKQQQTLRVKDLSDDTQSSGLTSCVTHNCLYVSDTDKQIVYKVKLSDKKKVIKWRVDGDPGGLSVNTACNLIVTCQIAGKVQEYNTASGTWIRDISLKSNGVDLRPLHAIQLTSDQFVVICYNGTKRVYDVVEVNPDGQLIVSYRNQLNSTSQHKFDRPRRLSVDENNKSILVCDFYNNRIVMLSRPPECWARELNVVLSVDGKLQRPSCLCFNSSRNRLFVGEWSGRVLVFDVI